MRYYPLFLDIARRRCVVVGGGSVAERKVARLAKVHHLGTSPNTRASQFAINPQCPRYIHHGS